MTGARKVLVTGGGGFLGSRIVQMLAERGDEVLVLGRNRYPHLERKGIRTVQADLRDASAVDRACHGRDVVFHVGALAGIWGPRKLFEEINVGGTRNVIAACRAKNVSKLVYTSSPSVVFGNKSLCGVDESLPYPKKFLAEYPRTKAMAERLVLSVDDHDLATIALRPHLIWGPGDPHLIPRIIQRARQGKLARIGTAEILVDVTYVDNAAHAHVLAADALSDHSPGNRRAYFISQEKPVELWSWLNSILSAVGIPEVRRSIPRSLAFAAGAVLEFTCRLAAIKKEPRMTRFLASQLSRHHYFDISAARRDLGYSPTISTEEGLVRLIEWLKSDHLAKALHGA